MSADTPPLQFLQSKHVLQQCPFIQHLPHLSHDFCSAHVAVLSGGVSSHDEGLGLGGDGPGPGGHGLTQFLQSKHVLQQ